MVNTTPTPPTGLAGWVSSEIDPNVVLRADPLDRAELSVSGIAAERLRDLGEPARPGDLMVVTDRPATGAADEAAPRCVAIATLAVVPRGAGGAPTSVCPAAPLAPETVVAEQAARARFGAALARNPSLELQPEAAAALQAGLVDPRLVLVLADLASPRRLAVEDFPVEPPEPPYALRRHVLLGAVDGLPASGDPQSLIRTWFAASSARSSPTRSRCRVRPCSSDFRPPPDGAHRRLTLGSLPCALPVAAARQVRRCVSTESAGMRRTRRRPVPPPFLSVGNRTVLGVQLRYAYRLSPTAGQRQAWRGRSGVRGWCSTTRSPPAGLRTGRGAVPDRRGVVQGAYRGKAHPRAGVAGRGVGGGAAGVGGGREHRLSQLLRLAEGHAKGPAGGGAAVPVAEGPSAVPDAPLPPTVREVGIDLGLTHFAVLSDGRKIDNRGTPGRPRRGSAAHRTGRRQRGSANREKSRRKVARCYARNPAVHGGKDVK